MLTETKRLQVIDSHTGGEPTRVVIDGIPDLGAGPIRDRLALLRDRFDWLRTAVIKEPRGSDVMVGAVVCQPLHPSSAAAVIFFNNVGYLGMCGHGAIGLVVSLAHLGRIGLGQHRLETVAGDVTATLHDDGSVSIENVPSFRYRQAVSLNVPWGTVVGDVAWGGNWFFLVSDHGKHLQPSHIESLTEYCWSVRTALREQGVTGRDGAEIDHIELIGPPTDPTLADAQNFVLCPGKAYDRSPCGTGTSAKVACLAADGRLKEGQTWRQQSIIGSVFKASFRRDGDVVIPTIQGKAYVNAEATLILDPRDPFACGTTS